MLGGIFEKHFTLSRKDCNIFVIVCIIIAISLFSFNPIRFLVLGLEMDNNLVSLGLAFFSIAIAFYASAIAIESDEKMKAIAEAGIQDSLSNLENVRRRYMDDVKSLLDRHDIEKNEVRSRILYCKEWATWMNFQYLKKALCYIKYLTNNDKENLFRYHSIIIDIMLENIDMLKNRNVEQLLMGCGILVEKLGNISTLYDKEDIFEHKFNGINMTKHSWEDFLTYIRRHIGELKEKGLDNSFELVDS